MSPLGVMYPNENDALCDPLAVREDSPAFGHNRSFDQMVLENLRSADEGVYGVMSKVKKRSIN